MKRAIWLAALLAAAVPSVATAEPSSSGAQAQQLADQAYDAYQGGDYAKALQLYQDSYRLAPAADILFNIAKIYDGKLKDRQLAVEYYRRYNASPDAKGDLVRAATARIAALNAEATPAPAPQPATAPAKPAAPPPESDPGTGWRVAGIVTGAVGLIGLGIGTVEGFAAKSKHNTAVNGGCANGNCPDPVSAQSERDASSAATVSTVGFIAGGALLVGGVAMYLLAPKKPADSAPPPAVGSLRLAPMVGPQAVGLTFSGRLF